MKLDKILNFKKVRCVKAYDDCLKIGKEYNVIDISVEIKVKDDRGDFLYWESNHFEPVIESAENPLEKMELTPEFEAVVPHVSEFKAGDPVYWGLKSKIFKIHRFMSTNVLEVELDGVGVTAVHKDELCPATQENYERLQATFPNIEFEQPPKPLTGSDLCRAMLEKGWKYVPCYVHDGSDDEAINRKHYVSVKNETPRSGYNFSGTGANDWKYAVPIDPKTGEPLTESILND